MISKKFWNDKSVLITGGSSGIGRAMAMLAAASGARVGLIARTGDMLAEVVSEIRTTGGVVEKMACDVTDVHALQTAVQALEQHLGPVDVAIACAGVHRVTWPLDAERSREVIDVNVNGTVNFLATVIPGMLKRRRGHVCGVASLASLVGLRKNAAYAASKAAVVMFLESLRVDCRQHGISVTTACPGYVDTKMITPAERASGVAIPAEQAADTILAAIEKKQAEVWFPRWTALQASLLRLLPPRLRDAVVCHLPAMEEASSGE
ncbi:MAG: SDR family NAD(P)-dependent oxidoreductase [Pirellulales bacterium]